MDTAEWLRVLSTRRRGDKGALTSVLRVLSAVGEIAETGMKRELTDSEAKKLVAGSKYAAKFIESTEKLFGNEERRRVQT